MKATDTRVETAQAVLPETGRPHAPLFAVVGFDGSLPSRAALEAAIDLVRGRDGHLEIVYVAHLPAWVGMSAPALLGTREGFDEIAAELNDIARVTLDDREPRWRFHRRDGAIAEELVAAATELRRRHGPDATVVIMVGASAHLTHHIAGSVAVSLAREAGFPLLIVPAAGDAVHAPARP